jgi:phospholipid transport system substrate-binding protein
MKRRQFARALFKSAALALPLPTALRAEPSDPAQAADFIRQAGKELASVVGDASAPEEKRRRLQPFIDRVVDVPAVARFCLGRFWHLATREQQQEYVVLFHRVLMNNIVAHLGDYKQAKVAVAIGRPEIRDSSILVPTTIEREGSPPARVAWVVERDGDTLHIVDVIAEGTSLRLTVRNDYAAFLSRHGDNIIALIDALRQQAG